MACTFPHLIFVYLIFITLCICGKSNNDPPMCTICLQVLEGEYSIDAWDNPFHSYHNKDGIFCNSCSRIISEGITHGGFRYTDGRHLCSLCQISVVEDDSVIHEVYLSVIKQFEAIGIFNIPDGISVELINLIEMKKIVGRISHGDMKGFTNINNNHKPYPSYSIFILFGLPGIEFEAVLAHELMHVWLDKNYPHLEIIITEGLCNLGSALIYINDGTNFSNIHLKSMENNPHTIYGNGYREMKTLLEKSDWNSLLLNLNSYK